MARKRPAAKPQSKLKEISASRNPPYPGLLGGQFRRQMAGSGYGLLDRVVDTLEYHVPLPPLEFGMVDRAVQIQGHVAR